MREYRTTEYGNSFKVTMLNLKTNKESQSYNIWSTKKRAQGHADTLNQTAKYRDGNGWVVFMT